MPSQIFSCTKTYPLTKFVIVLNVFLCTSVILLCYTAHQTFIFIPIRLTWPLYVHREPDSTYFELPPGSQPGERPVPSTSTPGSHHSTAEGSMDVYHLRDMNDNVMVGTWASSKFILLYHFVVEHVGLFLLKRNSSILLAVFRSSVSDHVFLVGPQWHFNLSVLEANEQNQLLLYVFVVHFCMDVHPYKTLCYHVRHMTHICMSSDTVIKY